MFATLVVAVSGIGQAQNPTLVTNGDRVMTCSFLANQGHIPPAPEFLIIGDVNGTLPFDQVFPFEAYGIPSTAVLTRSDDGVDIIFDWATTGVEPVAVIVTPEVTSPASLGNAYIYDPTLSSDERLHNNGANEADALSINFVKFCFAPQEPPPPGGCTLTWGYWKTHSEYGPAPYDDTWNELPGGDGVPGVGDDGADTPFFDTAQTYYQILQTSSGGGNKYIGLAHQWIAASLSVLGGADPTDVASALAEAEALLDAWDGEWNNPRGYPRSVRNQMVSVASVLDAYNNGEIGPGHCDDDARTAQSNQASGSDAFARSSAYPNPFNPQSQFALTVVEDQGVRAELYNTLGQRVATLFEGYVEAGQTQQVMIDGARLPSGMYLVRIIGERFEDTFRVTLLK